MVKVLINMVDTDISSNSLDEYVMQQSLLLMETITSF